MRRSFLALPCVLALAACAQNPDTIVGLSVPVAAYAGQDCADVVAELARVSAQLAPLVEAQRRERNADNTTVALSVLLLPIAAAAAAGGVDYAGEIARLRGEAATLEALAPVLRRLIPRAPDLSGALLFPEPP